jgi:Domain of unknown function (DUF4349)
MKRPQILISTAVLLGMLVGCAKSDRSYGNDAMTTPVEESAPTSASSGGYSQNRSTASDKASNMAAEGDLNFAQADSISSMMSSSAAVGGPLNDTTQKFIRTAEARIRVKNVRNATFAVEKITARFDGYVAHTALESTINNETHTKVSDDSTLITTYFTVSNNFVLRVPTEHLDSTLRTIGLLAEYLDYRRIHAENATLLILRERLEARRINRSTARLEDAVDDTQAKLRDRAAIEEALYNKQTMADESLIRTLELKDQIKLSTINLQVYQRQDFVQEMVGNEKNIDAYKPGFWSDAGDALKSGWRGLLGLIVGLLHLWPLLGLILLVVGSYLIYRRKRTK